MKTSGHWGAIYDPRAFFMNPSPMSIPGQARALNSKSIFTSASRKSSHSSSPSPLPQSRKYIPRTTFRRTRNAHPPSIPIEGRAPRISPTGVRIGSPNFLRKPRPSPSRRHLQQPLYRAVPNRPGRQNWRHSTSQLVPCACIPRPGMVSVYIFRTRATLGCFWEPSETSSAAGCGLRRTDCTAAITFRHVRTLARGRHAEKRGWLNELVNRTHPTLPNRPHGCRQPHA
jgi:hypothetical protein